MQYIRIEASLLSVCVTEVLTIINSRPENYRILLYHFCNTYVSLQVCRKRSFPPMVDKNMGIDLLYAEFLIMLGEDEWGTYTENLASKVCFCVSRL